MCKTRRISEPSSEFALSPSITFYEPIHEKKYDCEVTREYLICSVPQNLPDRSRGANLKAIGMSINTTIRDGKMKKEVRYYILNKSISASRFAVAVRRHWGIENSLHWQLDVTFQEDKCRIRKGPARITVYGAIGLTFTPMPMLPNCILIAE
ncbi:Mobile element protein [hydrothermal vent metagenome]|uniref:Mobile element protein n=1 Tax=hydrothermal vent metagenome TaxID=652676 RepID=A0A3B1DGU4_9ZZZZ